MENHQKIKHLVLLFLSILFIIIVGSALGTISHKRVVVEPPFVSIIKYQISKIKSQKPQIHSKASYGTR